MTDRTVYRADRAMPDIGAEPGDLLVVRASDPHFPLLVVREFGHTAFARFLGSGMLDGLEPTAVDMEQPVARGRLHRPSPVATPIRASTDQCAIFELLASVGCRMPPGPT